MSSLIYVLIVGGIAGWLAGLVMKGGGMGLIMNIILGILGAFVGDWLLGDVLKVSLASGMLGDILESAIGAAVILFLASLFSGKK